MIITLTNTPNGIRASWNAVKGAKNYKLEKLSEDGSSWSVLARSLDKEYLDGNVYVSGDVLMGDKYTYRVSPYVGGKWKDPDEKTLLYNPFTDVADGNKVFGYISWAYNNMIVTGKGDGSIFDPAGGCTRLNFVMMLWKMNGRPKVEGIENPFTDVTGSTSLNAVLWAYSEGIIVGTSKTTFSPNAPVTRGNTVMMLWKMAGKPKVEIPDPFPFTDVTGAKTQKTVMWAKSTGITAGTGDGTTFSPKSTCTRAQLVTFLCKYDTKYNVVKNRK